MGLLRTGPLPPLSPFINSYASDQLSPLSSEVFTQVSQCSISLPTLKNKNIFPSGDRKRTGFQCASFLIFAICFAGDH